ncbi:MAG TPA: hypothetical protein VK919_09570 [Solirubrobacterales bacterium]|nr:hypothetical protein [Solirubrobacterales bacterium]
MLLIVGLAFGGWPVLIAAAIFVVVGGALLAAASLRRSREYVEHGDEASAPPTAERGGAHAAHGVPRSGGAPVSGEGS